ncbi:hypothetical protein [Chromobacterium haemolyticum]|uniref:hypothetical protein n=1 Tax=Chromobacterium haemolyticum TaxID=394935 RepID=UPI00244CE705|nr:hypothetical protein [Chromobacterium haemolyticum]MDH0342117.1 hypothetical protein [Chromobacterium haemolyticum]
MARQQYIHGLSDGSDKRLYVGEEPVTRLIILSGVENPHEKMVVQTFSGRVLLRSLDGKKSQRAAPDLFYDPESCNGPVIVNAG